MPPHPLSSTGSAEPPLLIDTDTLRRAARASRTELSRAFEAEDVALANAPISETQRLASAIDQAGVPDCLRPDALKHQPVRLGGLLDLPLLAFAAATGKCR